MVGGTIVGGRKIAATNKRKYGKDYYKRIGALGGAKSHVGGFGANRELASIAGIIGGQVSRLNKPLDARKRRKIVERYWAHLDFQEGFNR